VSPGGGRRADHGNGRLEWGCGCGWGGHPTSGSSSSTATAHAEVKGWEVSDGGVAEA
jgi:hypothetical protein